jgi:hypothetical protein
MTAASCFVEPLPYGGISNNYSVICIIIPIILLNEMRLSVRHTGADHVVTCKTPLAHPKSAFLLRV